MKNIGKKAAVLLALALAMALTLAACGGGGSSEAPADTGGSSAAAEEPAAEEPADAAVADMDTVSTAAKTVEFADGIDEMPTPTIVPVPAGYEGQTWELSLDDQGNDQMPLGLSEKDICKAIELRTNGQVKITPYFNNSLLEQNNKWPGAVQGLADIVLYTIDMNAGAQPMHSVLNQPANLPYPSNANTVLAVREFIANHPEFDAETESQGVVTISYFFNPATTLHMAKGEVKAATDLKGKKLIGNASIKPYVEGLGAASIAMGPGEFYTSLEKGVADGLVTHWAIVRDFNLLDVFESHTILGSSTAGINATCITWIMNKGVWDTIPPEYQAVIKEEFDWAGYSTCQYNDAVREAVIADAEAMGQAVNILSEEESAPFFENATEASKVWIAAAEAEGVTDAQALYDDWMAVLDKYN